MKAGKGFVRFGLIITGILGIFVVGNLFVLNELPNLLEIPNSDGSPSLVRATTGQPVDIESDDPIAPEQGIPGWINNDGRFTPQSEQLLSWLEAGYPLDLQVGLLPRARYGFSEIRVTSDDFRISTGPDAELPSEYRVYSGRQLDNGRLGEDASLAIVNGAVSMTVTRDGQNFLIETDPASGELYAVALQSFDNPHECGTTSCSSQHTACTLSPDGTLATVRAPAGSENTALQRIPVTMVYPADRIEVSGEFEAAEEPTFEAGTGGKPYLRNGSEYDASLKDILIMVVSSKSQSGATSGLSSKAASYFAYAARAADVYERQLGLRYLLQEMFLVASDSSQTDPGNPSGTNLGDDLYHFADWLNANRPQSTYRWGHAALWTLVDGGGGGVIGLAWTDSYGAGTYGASVQEPNWGWEVHSHELGHNVGSSHTSGGVMNPSINRGNEDFFTYVSGQSYTAAKDIYNYMSPSSRSYVFGDALLRNPQEIPFGVDDVLTTPANTKLVFNPIANDLTKKANGTVNTLRLVEVGQVYPKAAGSTQLNNGQVEFTPAAGFTGQAWMTYTVGGDVGNNGNGWLHRADIVITVGGDSTAPTTAPAISLKNDFISSELTGPERFNPLLNDEGTGRLWAGDVEVVLSANDSSPELYSNHAFWLVDASVVTGTGSLNLETRSMTRSSSSQQVNTGYMTYTPGQNESGQVVIEYTVMDAFGNTATAQVVMAESASVSVSADYLTVAEDSGDVITLTFSRSAIANLSVEEVIGFTVGGTTDPTGLRPDFALSGQDDFSPVNGAGLVTIPAGATEAIVFVAIDNDGIDEGQETITIDITAASSLLISSGAGDVTIWINDNSLVYQETFDSFTSDSATWNGWTNLKNKNASGKGGEDSFDWSINSYGTPTGNTGPSNDHTSGAGKYFLAEATGNEGTDALLDSAVISTTGVGDGNLEFWYHMYGSNMGGLSVDLYANGSLVAANVWSVSGQQSTNGTDWKKASINVAPYLPATNLKLRFRADVGSSGLSDIAIDDIKLTALSSSLPQPPAILAEPNGCQVNEGDSVYLSVISQAFPAPQVQWYRNGAAIPGATGAAYFINSVDSSYAGTYEAVVSNPEGTIMSYPAQIELPPAPPDSSNQTYIDWAEANLSSDVWFLGDDPEHDGILNIFEFAFGLDPNAASNSGMPVVNQADVGGEQFLEIKFRRRTDHASIGVTYAVETSSSLNSGWSSAGADVEEISSLDNGDGTETVTARRRSALSNGPGFLRVNVSGLELTPPPGP